MAAVKEIGRELVPARSLIEKTCCLSKTPSRYAPRPPQRRGPAFPAAPRGVTRRRRLAVLAPLAQRALGMVRQPGHGLRLGARLRARDPHHAAPELPAAPARLTSALGVLVAGALDGGDGRGRQLGRCPHIHEPGPVRGPARLHRDRDGPSAECGRTRTLVAVATFPSFPFLFSCWCSRTTAWWWCPRRAARACAGGVTGNGCTRALATMYVSSYSLLLNIPPGLEASTWR